MRRRDLLAMGAAIGLSTLPGAGLALGSKSGSTLKLGIIGTGMRGQVLLHELVRRDDVHVAAICDLDKFMLDRADRQFAEANKKKPKHYTGSDQAWREMLTKEKLDGVIIATPWRWHAPMAIGAMQAGVAVGCEVVAGITLQDHYDVLDAWKKSGTPYMLLENVCFRRDVLAVLNIARQGLFGEIIHLQGGYQHDLRAVKFNAGEPGKAYGGGAEFGDKGWSEARWRTQHSVERNGDLYPSHGIGPCAMQARINRGNRFVNLTSYASKARGLHNYVVDQAGEDHPNAKVNFALGDVVQTQIGCANGETILLTHDTSLPRPYDLGFRVQGTKGLWMDTNDSIYIEGVSPPHKWEPAGPWLEKYDHPLWQRFATEAEGAGHGGMDFFVIHAFVEALKAGAPMPIDIYDALSWSAITPLSEKSIAEANKTVVFPDFTEGKWKDREVIFALDNRY